MHFRICLQILLCAGFDASLLDDRGASPGSDVSSPRSALSVDDDDDNAAEQRRRDNDMMHEQREFEKIQRMVRLSWRGGGGLFDD